VTRPLVQRLTPSDSAPLAALLGLAAIGAIFQSANSNFLTPLNLTNLLGQIAAVGTIAVGLVLVFLIGEIDLSVGAVSGLGAAVMAVLSTRYGVPGGVAIGIGILTGTLTGLLHGVWITHFRVPSLIVTLSGFLAWQGLLLYVLGETGTLNLTDATITGIANQRLPVIWGWVFAAVIVLVYVLVAIWEQRRRGLAGVSRPPVRNVVLRVGLVAAGVLGVVALMSLNRSPTSNSNIQGMPLGVVVLGAIVLATDMVVRRTRFGRHLFAIGGNAEAARRAGIDVDRVRVTVFTLAATLAACGGILSASRLYSVNQSSGAGVDVLLSAMAAPVIGGTSLFGGRGSAWSALLGALVIGAISNGMDLLALAASIKFMITGLVLLVAVTVDALARRSREAAIAAAPLPSAPSLPDLALGPGLLTPREREVAGLIAQGLTNRQIAETLMISERTAGAHVEHMLSKLKFRSRAQVAVWAAEHGLQRPTAASGRQA
jgi:D-xylose transport system permease protein